MTAADDDDDDEVDDILQLPGKKSPCSVGFTDTALKFCIGSVTLVLLSVPTFHLHFRNRHKCKGENRKQERAPAFSLVFGNEVSLLRRVEPI